MYITNGRVFGGDSEHFDILVISGQFEAFLSKLLIGALTIHTELQKL